MASRVPEFLRAQADAIRENRLRTSAPVAHSPSWFLEPGVYHAHGEFRVQYGIDPQVGVAGFGATLDQAYRRFRQALVHAH